MATKWKQTGTFDRRSVSTRILQKKKSYLQVLRKRYKGEFTDGVRLLNSPGKIS